MSFVFSRKNGPHSFPFFFAKVGGNFFPPAHRPAGEERKKGEVVKEGWLLPIFLDRDRRGRGKKVSEEEKENPSFHPIVESLKGRTQRMRFRRHAPRHLSYLSAARRGGKKGD